MSWETAENKLRAHFEEVKKAKKEGKRAPWFSKQFGSLSEMEQAFDTTAENAKMIELLRGESPDLNKLMGVEHKLCFVAQARGGIRRQHIAQTSTQRKRRDYIRFDATAALHHEKVLKRLKTRLTQEREQSTVG